MSSRVPPITYLSLAVAVFSLATAMYQGWLQTRNLEAVQRDLARREVIRGCKDAIEAYFEAKLRLRLAGEPALGAVDAQRRYEAAASAVARLAAVGTFLANGQSEEARAVYTDLSHEMERIAAAGRADELDVAAPDLFSAADRLFARMNADCVGSTRIDPI